MRSRIHAAAAVLTLALGATSQAGVVTTFNYTGALQTYTVATTGLYTITAAGAQGGSTGNSLQIVGAGGATLSGDIQLTAGTVLTIVVGGVGGDGYFPATGVTGGGGGGGGTFLYVIGAAQPLMVAGGGGGVGTRGTVGGGLGGATGTAGLDGKGTNGGAGGVNGLGGSGSPGAPGNDRNGGGGAGWLGNGTAGGNSQSGNGGFSGPTFAGGTAAVNGVFVLGGNGGYGGGGGAGFAGGGGGGGYSGGGGGEGLGFGGGGGGGGSFLDASFVNTSATAGNRLGAGIVTIASVDPPNAVPEPATLGGLAIGLGLTGLIARRRTNRATQA